MKPRTRSIRSPTTSPGERVNEGPWDGADEAPVSKSALKREHHQLKALGEELSQLSDRQWLALGLDERLRDALAVARKLKHGALQRQLRHLANLLEECDADAIRQALKAMLEPSREAIRQLHDLERWRDALAAGDEGVLTEIAARCRQIDFTQLRQLARAAGEERADMQTPRAARKLFIYLRDSLVEASSDGQPVA